ncbi:DUF6414 family protein [Halolactibacillus sp. JCM 19043]|uniref:DUF6414 family protein n=1 Tax=Halolactibacillus sp. JCM 19043 TaxID=1460638 RepID=UPI0007822492|nr:DUF6414 family protein [Halolactibacillus sp. JCM 19043]
MKKIIYFDESSALDILDLKNEGRSQEIMENIVKKANDMSIGAKVGTGILDIFNFGGSFNVKGGASRNKSNILTTNLTNTILTSFVDLIDDKESKGYGIQELKDSKLYIVPESAAFIKSITPFVKIFKTSEELTDTSNPFSPENINLHSFDEVLLNAKGYYELVAINRRKTKRVVRFNLDGLRNNYKLHDLQKMNLTMYGIRVGKCLEESLKFEKDIIGDSEGVEEQTKPTGYDPHKKDQYNPQDPGKDVELEIIDIILAGIN